VKFQSSALDKVIAMCDRSDFRVEQLNARTAKRGAFDASALTAWLYSLARSVDCERAAMRPEVREAAAAALRELRPQLEPRLVADETSVYMLRGLRDFVR
jgi:hypothetical protein